MASSEAHYFLCPYCSGEVPNVAEKAFDRGKLYLDQAWALPKRSEEQKKYANEPMETVKITNELLSLNKRHPGIMDW